MALMTHKIEMCHLHNNDFGSVNGIEILQAFMNCACIMSVATISISQSQYCWW